jgi:aminoglycoside phosphotransferase family enzyme/predicted kinase
MMIIENQSEVLDFLSAPSTHGAPVERIETHSAVVFLAGDRAYKLKRAVRFDYMDFSTLERRRLSCEAEVRLNRRTAPQVYRGVVPVCRRDSGVLALGREGAVVEWLVEMNRFDQESVFDRMAAAGRLDIGLMPALAAAIASFHRDAEVRRDHAGVKGMAWVIDGNETGFAEFGAGAFDLELCAGVTRDARLALQRLGRLLEDRRQSGYVRHCHGDLHLRNIVLIDGRPTLFDGVEFNDEIACIDVLYDVAFLVMDLWRRRLPRHANAVFNHYLMESGDLEALPAFPLFLSCRAAVRAKTNATAARMQDDEARRRELHAAAGEYLAMADRLIHPPTPCVIAVGGFSGSGKSTVAMALAPSTGAVPGAVMLRSDEVRKRVRGVDRLDRLGPDGYTAEVSNRVYDTLIDRARTVVQAGHPVIVDAVFAQPDWRAAIERVAIDAAVPFLGCWLDAPEAVSSARVDQRRADPSDADTAVVRRQYEQDAGTIEWHRVDASGSLETVVEAVSRLRELELPSTARQSTASN